ncbi:hypothetical protein QVN49_06015 [Megasphaera hexanoica]|nr:hypothetical protein [Megasphaera hexanoica]
MKKLRLLLLTFLLTLCSSAIVSANFFPNIGPLHYLGEASMKSIAFHVYIADDNTINTMINWKYYTPDNRKWIAKVLAVPQSEEYRKAIVSMVNEGVNKNWVMNNQLYQPVNNRIWALREDVYYYPNEQAINVNGAWVYNDDGDMLAIDTRQHQATIRYKYGEDPYYTRICDLVSAFMAQRYSEAVLNSQNYTR